MPALLLGTFCGLFCAGLAMWAGAGIGMALVAHALCGAVATLLIAWLQYMGQTPEDAFAPEPDPVS